MSSEAPGSVVAAALSEAAALGPFFTLAVGGPDAGWHPVTDAYDRGFADLVQATADRYRTDEPRIGASIVQLGHAARLWSPLLYSVLAHGVLPDLGRLQRADDGPALRVPEAAGHHVDDDVAEALYRAVITDHLEPFASGLKVKVARPVLYGNAASALAEAARDLRAARPDLATPAHDLATRLLTLGHLHNKGTFTSPSLTFRRRTCCLYYRTPTGSKCPDCALA
ncbi:(2Fe-2S)-binding protein [Actinocorallia sp. API 0066]|uniref:(2Fe-2S)-binding protein n=1 Tax=Actinocorallia sp. API 0066 TaxID=2896846 RepID=UPI001E4A2CE5|nr:(2Fe-2S)-binding protein [Actinocorallia sp. API 0066]MCD0449167.1 (2Fe-2S)-binding protein [Actinocorallia sp. API 0066]